MPTLIFTELVALLGKHNLRKFDYHMLSVNLWNFRYEEDGQAIMILTPEEEPEMLNELKLKKIPISQLE
jgi:hypothetical protein